MKHLEMPGTSLPGKADHYRIANRTIQNCQTFKNPVHNISLIEIFPNFKRNLKDVLILLENSKLQKKYPLILFSRCASFQHVL